MRYENTLEFAREQDEEDPLKEFRKKFYIPLYHGKPAIYFAGNSLGLQPTHTQDYINNFLQDWANFGVEGHFHGKSPWLSYHEIFPSLLSGLTGALPGEIIVMNQLTVNLHLLFITFYRPGPVRYKILCESKAFPSDQYALESQVRLHGLNPADSIIEIEPREGEASLRTEDILEAINKHSHELAVVFFGGVNYYSGEVIDMKSITRAAHKVGACCGFDLAHAIGNITLKLHEWEVDFACWCSYKYLNSGPGGVAGAYIHERFIGDQTLLRLAGWWGHDKSTRFLMDKGFNPIPTAEGWQLSNAPILSMAAHKCALDIFEEAGITNLVRKSTLLTEYLFYLIDEVNTRFNSSNLHIITPRGGQEHGCQVSILVRNSGRELFKELQNKGVIADWREPDVIRVAPVPLYNTFEEVYNFGEILSGWQSLNPRISKG